MKKFLWGICFFVVFAAAGIGFLFSPLCPSDVQYKIGYCYYYGIHVETNHESAYGWFKKSADKGNRDAEYMLGDMYSVGNYVKQDYKKAFEWYQKSANQGNARAQCCIGLYYESGSGVAQDLAKAFEWFQKSAEQGYEAAKFALKEMQTED